MSQPQDLQTDYEHPPLSQDKRKEVFLRATSALTNRYVDQLADGMNDADLHAALKDVLGTFGGSGGPDRLSICHTGTGLKIWGAKTCFNHCIEQPLFSGKVTIEMARIVYKIADPDDDQLSLL